jgi:hypothetical protein
MLSEQDVIIRVVGWVERSEPHQFAEIFDGGAMLPIEKLIDPMRGSKTVEGK